jgi:LysM repeat protein/preprotein translocase subunit YajC
MKETRSFETYDLVKLAIFLVIILITAFLILKPDQNEQTVTKAMETEQSENTTVILTPIEGSSGTTDQEAEATLEPGSQTDQTTEEAVSGEPSSPAEVPVMPEIPAGSQDLLLAAAEGSLYTMDGRLVYVVSADNLTWIPVVPPELSEQTGGAIPIMDSEGNWFLVGSGQDDNYTWDWSTSTWVLIDESVVFVPAPSQPQAGPPSSEIEQPVTGTQETPTPETGASQGETGSTEGDSASGETGSSEQGTEAQGTESAGDTGGSEGSSTGSGEGTSTGVDLTTLVTPVPVVPKIYTVHTGEFVYCLARRFDIHPHDILWLNGLTYNNLIFAGTNLKIPKDPRSFPGQRALINHPVEHTVQSGQTIYSIACLYGDVYPEAIIAVNELTAPYALTPGQVLIIP